LNTAIGEGRILNVLLQVNTSGEEAKSGLPPLAPSSPAGSQLVELAQYIVTKCDRLHLQGLMTIGSLAQSFSTSENKDFETLTASRDALQDLLNANREVMQKSVDDRLKTEGREVGQQVITWGEDGRLLLSMGMSSDFETALRAGSDIIRVGTGIFGERPMKGGAN
jgi:PLP dependent protein